MAEKDLSTEELLDWLNLHWGKATFGNIVYEDDAKDEQAYSQIKAMILNKQKQELMQRLGAYKEAEKMTEHELRTEVIKLRAKVNRLQQPRIEGMSEPNRDELIKKLNFLKMIYDKSVSPTHRAKEEMEQAHSQIKAILEQPRTVGRERFGKLVTDIYTFKPSEEYTLYDFLKDKFEELNIKVED